MDKVTETEARRLETLVGKTYANNNSCYPKIIGCITVSCVKPFNNNLDKLRQFIYDTTLKLRIKPNDGVTCKYNKYMYVVLVY